MNPERYAEFEWRETTQQTPFELSSTPATAATRKPAAVPKPRRQLKLPFDGYVLLLILVSTLYTASALGAI